jgi:hypothetical protein
VTENAFRAAVPLKPGTFLCTGPGHSSTGGNTISDSPRAHKLDKMEIQSKTSLEEIRNEVEIGMNVVEIF